MLNHRFCATSLHVYNTEHYILPLSIFIHYITPSQSRIHVHEHYCLQCNVLHVTEVKNDCCVTPQLTAMK